MSSPEVTARSLRFNWNDESLEQKHSEDKKNYQIDISRSADSKTSRVQQKTFQDVQESKQTRNVANNRLNNDSEVVAGVADMSIQAEFDEPAFQSLFASLSGDLERQQKQIEANSKFLKRYPSFVNKQNADGMTPLMHACKNGCFEYVKLLLQHPDIEIEKSDIFNKTAVHYAIESKLPEIVESVLRKCSSAPKDIACAFPIDNQGNTLLHYSFKIQNIELIQPFSRIMQCCMYDDDSYEIPFFTRNNFGVTPFSNLANSRDRTIIEKVLSTIEKCVHDGFDALLSYIETEVAEFDQDIRDLLLSISVVAGHTSIPKALIRGGANCNSVIGNNHDIPVDRFPNGTTVFMYLLAFVKDDELQNLAFERANLELTASGLNPLHYVCLGGNFNMFRELVAFGVDVNATGTHGQIGGITVLMSAAQGGSEEIIDALLVHHINFDSANSSESSEELTAFDYAVHCGRDGIVCKFLENNFSFDLNVDNFNYFVSQFSFANDENNDRFKNAFKPAIQKMLDQRPEFLLLIAVRSNGDDLLDEFIDNRESSVAVIENMILQNGAIVGAFPIFNDIVNDLSNNNHDVFKGYLNRALIPTEAEINILMFYVSSISKEERITGAWHTIDNTFERYEQISKAVIEKNGISSNSKLKIAFFIEHNIKKVLNVADGFFRTCAYLPRSLILQNGEISILSNHKFSILNAEGSCKRINNAAIVSLENLRSLPVNAVTTTILPHRIQKYGIEAVKRELLHEWEIMQKFKGMDGFVQCYHFNEEGLCYVVDKYDGEYFDILGDEITVEQKISCAEQMIRSVIIMHNKNVMHRDLKPENILYKKDADRNIKVALTDFGHSVIMRDGMRALTNGGTDIYSSPELYYKITQLDNPEKCKKYDVYSLGLTLYETLYVEKFPIGQDGDSIVTVLQEEYERRHSETIKGRLDFLLTKEDGELDLKYRYEIIILQMLAYNPNDRIPLEEAHEKIMRLMNRG